MYSCNFIYNEFAIVRGFTQVNLDKRCKTTLKAGKIDFAKIFFLLVIYKMISCVLGRWLLMTIQLNLN